MKNTFFFFFSFVILVSCTKPKVTNLSFMVFETNRYTSMDQAKKLLFLDSLHLSSISLKNDSIVREFLFHLSSEYYYLNKNEKSLAVCQKLLNLSEQAKDTTAIAKSYYYIGDCYEISHKDSAYYYYQKAEKLYRNQNNDLMIGKMHFNKAYLLFYEGNYTESEIMLAKSLQFLKKSDDKKLLYAAYNLMGANFGKLEEFDNAIKYYMLAKVVLNDIIHSDNEFDKNNNLKIGLIGNLAEVYRKTGQYEKGIQELEIVLKTNLKKEWPTYYATIIGNLGYTKLKSGNLEGVEKLLKEALSISQKSGNEASVVYKLNYLGEFYAVVHDTVKSIDYLKKSLLLAEKLHSSDDIKINLKLLSKIDHQNDSFYNKRYIVISDSLAKVQRNNRNKYARIEYETSVVEDKNKELSMKNLYLILGLSVIVFLSGGILIYRYIQNQKRELAHQKQHQKAEEEMFELLKDYQTKLNTIKLKEQNRISMELHDNVLNKLYGTRLQLGILNSSDAQEVKEKRLGYVDLLQEIELEIRNISHDLHTDTVEVHFDYIDLLQDLIQEKNELGITLFSFYDSSELDWNAIDGLVKITIFRIVQEALLNVIKYAEATVCSVTLTKIENNKLKLLIEDDGKGFENSSKENDGIGLKNMQERARLAKAELTITSTLGEGTKIAVVFDC